MKKQQGFTVVELIIVIGIFISISVTTIFALNDIRSTLKNDIRSTLKVEKEPIITTVFNANCSQTFSADNILFRQYRLKEDYVLSDDVTKNILKAGSICVLEIDYTILDFNDGGEHSKRENIKCYQKDFTLDQLNLFEPVL